jgi:hypothetical protein
MVRLYRCIVTREFELHPRAGIPATTANPVPTLYELQAIERAAQHSARTFKFQMRQVCRLGQLLQIANFPFSQFLGGKFSAT